MSNEEKKAPGIITAEEYENDWSGRRLFYTLRHHESETARLAAERDDLQRQLDAANARIERGGVEFDVAANGAYNAWVDHYRECDEKGCYDPINDSQTAFLMAYLARHATVVREDEPPIASAETLEQSGQPAASRERWKVVWGAKGECDYLFDGTDKIPCIETALIYLNALLDELERVEAEREHYRRSLASVNAIQDAHTPDAINRLNADIAATAEQCYHRFWCARGIEEADWDDIGDGERDGWEAVAGLLRGGWTCPAGVTIKSLCKEYLIAFSIAEGADFHEQGIRAVLRQLGLDGQVPEE